MRGGRGLAATALHGQADRCRGRRVAGDRQPHSGGSASTSSALEPAEPIRRYERDNPGELIHLDIKKLGRIGSVGHRITGRSAGVVNRHHGIGGEYVHVCIDDLARRFRAGHAQPTQRERHLPDGGHCLLRQARGPRRTRDIGQRFVLPVEDLPRRLQTNRSATSLHETLHAEDKRKGGAIHPNRASRMGLRASLPELRSAIRRAAQLAPSL